MIRHCVMLRLREDADPRQVNAVMLDLAKVVDRLDGCGDFCAGPNRDFEDKTPDYAYGFTLDARNAKALAAYAVDPEHKALGAQLVDLCHGGGDGILVFDIEVPR
ncbi:Dabb family protein [Tateyamaria pelophila]|uniref:Dabb family protein n=1 Tax=Tateyamaria pelophila TaxID=328415 RepID=UPI001CBE7833|nr:Dabb family protein [Tateyamaria pelophila]